MNVYRKSKTLNSQSLYGIVFCIASDISWDLVRRLVAARRCRPLRGCQKDLHGGKVWVNQARVEMRDMLTQCRRWGSGMRSCTHLNNTATYSVKAWRCRLARQTYFEELMSRTFFPCCCLEVRLFSLIIILTTPRIYREISKLHYSDPHMCAFIYIIGCQAAPCSLFSQSSYPAKPL